METLFHVCCVPVLELKPKMVKFCHQIQISKTRNANLQNSFKNLTINEIVKKLMLNAKKKNPLCCSVALHCFPLFGAKSLSAYVEGDFVHASMSFSERERERERA